MKIECASYWRYSGNKKDFFVLMEPIQQASKCSHIFGSTRPGVSKLVL